MFVRKSFENLLNGDYDRTGHEAYAFRSGLKSEYGQGKRTAWEYFSGCADSVLSNPKFAPIYGLWGAVLAYAGLQLMLSLSDHCGFTGALLDGDSDELSSCVGQIGDLFTRTFGTVIEEGFCTRTIELDNTWGPLGLLGEITTARERLPFGTEGEGIVCTPPVLSIAASLEQHLGSVLAKLLNSGSAD